MNIKAAILGVGVLALAACDTTMAASSNVSAQMNSFYRDALAAEVIADQCPSLSMVTSTETLVDSFLEQMIANGAVPGDLYLASQMINEDAIMYDLAVDMSRNGVDADVPATWCAYGQQQIAAGHRVGRFLR